MALILRSEPKNHILINEVLSKHNPRFKTIDLDHITPLKDVLDTSILTEEAIAYRSNGYLFLSPPRANNDFCDLHGHPRAESKLMSLCLRKDRCSTTYHGSIHNLKNKTTALKILTIYFDERTGEGKCHFFHLPFADWQLMTGDDKDRLKVSYNQHTDSYNRLDPYRYDTFEEMAAARNIKPQCGTTKKSNTLTGLINDIT